MNEDKKDLVVYKNDLNTIPLKDFKSVEMDILFAILSQIRDKGTNEVVFDFNKLKKLSQYREGTNNNDFIKDLESTYRKLINLDVRLETDQKIVGFAFFTKYVIDKELKTVSIATNKEFAPFINELTGNFTKFELEEITEIQSSYSKACYRLLKQYRKTGYYKVHVDKLRSLLDVPKSYTPSNFVNRILKPIKRDLTPYFKGLKMNKIRDKYDGRKVAYIEFYFKPQDDIDKDGYSTFKDIETGEYKKRHLYQFTDEDVKKEFPEPQIQGQISTDDLIWCGRKLSN